LQKKELRSGLKYWGIGIQVEKNLIEAERQGAGQGGGEICARNSYYLDQMSIENAVFSRL